MIRVGHRRHKVEIHKPVETQDGSGQAVITYQRVGWHRAAIRPLGGRELIDARQVSARATHRVTLRYFESVPVHTGYRILHLGRALNVESVLNVDEMNTDIQALCTEIPQ